MVECVRGLDDISKYRRFRLLRPEQSIHESPKAWWLYAARCHGLKIVPRHNIHNITKENLRYIDIFTKLIINPNETLSNEQKDFKDKVEKERDYYELKFLREVSAKTTENCWEMINFHTQIQFSNISDLYEPKPEQWFEWCGNQSRTWHASAMVPTVVGLVQSNTNGWCPIARFIGHKLVGWHIRNTKRPNSTRRWDFECVIKWHGWQFGAKTWHCLR